jgi:hypothetical protein
MQYIENIQVGNGTKYKINIVPFDGVQGQVLSKTGQGKNDFAWTNLEKYDDSQILEAINNLQQNTFTKEEVQNLIKDFITQVPDEYITEEELTEKGFLVKSDIYNKADKSNTYTKTQVDALIPTDYVKDEDLSTVAMSGSYNDLTDKPTIVTFRQW